MSTIRDELVPVASGAAFPDLALDSPEAIRAEKHVRSALSAVLLALGTDPALPAEWATVDRCLTWLRGQHALDLGDVTPVWLNGGESPLRSGYAVVIFGPDDSEFCGEGETAHAALIAACKAVQEASDGR